MTSDRNGTVLGGRGDFLIEIPAFTWTEVLRLRRSVILNYIFKLC